MRKLALVAAAATIAMPMSADAATPKRYKNCAALNKTYPHGVGKKGARDRVSGSMRPVTTFARKNKVYRLNTARDRDKDGIACEKR